jgi:hypothetical protein
MIPWRGKRILPGLVIRTPARAISGAVIARCGLRCLGDRRRRLGRDRGGRFDVHLARVLILTQPLE